MFTLVLMSHGTRGSIIFDVDDQPIGLADIQQLFSSRNFPAVKYKPKLMIVQACSGGPFVIRCTTNVVMLDFTADK